MPVRMPGVLNNEVNDSRFSRLHINQIEFGQLKHSNCYLFTIEFIATKNYLPYRLKKCRWTCHLWWQISNSWHSECCQCTLLSAYQRGQSTLLIMLYKRACLIFMPVLRSTAKSPMYFRKDICCNLNNNWKLVSSGQLTQFVRQFVTEHGDAGRKPSRQSIGKCSSYS